MIFRPLSAESYGVEQNPSFLATFFSSACNFGRNSKSAKTFGRPDQQIHSRLTKTIFMHLGQILAKSYGVLGRGETPGFPSLQIPIPISFKSAQGDRKKGKGFCEKCSKGGGGLSGFSLIELGKF